MFLLYRAITKVCFPTFLMGDLQLTFEKQKDGAFKCPEPECPGDRVPSDQVRYATECLATKCPMRLSA